MVRSRLPGGARVTGPGARKQADQMSQYGSIDDADLSALSARAGQTDEADVVFEAGNLGRSRETFNGEETIVASSPVNRTPACLEAHLIVIAHPLEHCLGRRYSLKPGAVLEVGRTADAEIGFPEVPSISRRHARVSYLAEGVCL